MCVMLDKGYFEFYMELEKILDNNSRKYNIYNILILIQNNINKSYMLL